MSDPIRNWSAITLGIAAELLDAEEALRTDAIAAELGKSERTIRDLLSRLCDGQLVSRARIQTGEAGNPPWGYWLSADQIPGAQRALRTPTAPLGSEAVDDAANAPPPGSVQQAGSGQPIERAGTGVEEEQAEPRRFLQQSAELATTENLKASGSSSEPSRRPLGQLLRGQELVLVDVRGPAFSQLLEGLSDTRTVDDATWIARIGDEVAFAFEATDTTRGATDLLAVLAGARLSVRLAVVGQVAPIDDLIEQARRVTPEIRRARSTRDAHDDPR
jgi:hypothetical protein